MVIIQHCRETSSRVFTGINRNNNMQKYTLEAEKRKIFGRKVKSLRREGLLPANIYGKNIESLAIQVSLNDFEKVYKEAGETRIIELSIGKEKRPVLISNVQLDPVSDIPLHVDFKQVNLKEKVSAAVPIELVGESPAEKKGLGTAVQYLDEIEVEALPTDLPEKFEVDLTVLEEVDQTVFVKDLVSGSDKVEIKTDPEKIIVKVEPPRKEEEIAPPTEEAEEEVVAEGEAEAQEGEKEEGESKKQEGQEDKKEEEKN